MFILYLAKNRFHPGNIRVRATNKDPQDVAARLHERIERLDEAFEVSLVEQRLAVKAWRDASNDAVETVRCVRKQLWKHQCLERRVLRTGRSKHCVGHTVHANAFAL